MTPEIILKRAGIRLSPVRELVVKVLIEAAQPLSAAEIEETLDTVDRSSISRTLTQLCEHDAVHTIEDGSGSVKYELCHSSDDDDNDQHVHFHCLRCGETICLNDSLIPEITLPEGFTAHSANFVIKGICAGCRK